jgi:hypothetical protein
MEPNPESSSGCLSDTLDQIITELFADSGSDFLIAANIPVTRTEYAIVGFRLDVGQFYDKLCAAMRARGIANIRLFHRLRSLLGVATPG